VPARCADQQVRGSIRPIQPEQRQTGRVEKGTAGIEVISRAVGALHLFPSHLVMLRIVTGIGTLELVDEAHESTSPMITTACPSRSGSLAVNCAGGGVQGTGESNGPGTSNAEPPARN